MSSSTGKNSYPARKNVGIPDERFPSSVAIIMDGNGRWADRRNQPRSLGHVEGAETAREIISEASDLGLENLTLYAFSRQNWKRATREVGSLMDLYAEYLAGERETLMKNNIRMRHLGSREGLPAGVLEELDESIRASANNSGMILSLAMNYGSREEIAEAAAKLARRVKGGELEPGEIDENLFARTLDTAGIPDPDLLIRTAGEMRISNYLLYQISYAEFYVTETLWPDFHVEEFHKAIRAYAERDRRFGAINDGK